jgi:hypothetical protein
MTIRQSTKQPEAMPTSAFNSTKLVFEDPGGPNIDVSHLCPTPPNQYLLCEQNAKP